MNAPTDSSAFFIFCFFLLLLINLIVGVCSRREKNEDFLLFTITHPKINMNVVKIILPQQSFADKHQRKRQKSAEANFKGCDVKYLGVTIN